MQTKHKIYCFNNGGSPGWLEAVAIGDDGHVVGNHICSHEAFMKHDLGVTSNWKHDNYNKQYGEDNWELEWDRSRTVTNSRGVEQSNRVEQRELGQPIPDDIKAGATLEFTDGTKVHVP